MGYNLHTNVSTFIQEERLVEQEVPENAPELARTALRRLTLTVENAFPDTRRRQRVVKTDETVLNPLELACECLLFKTAQIRHILSAADIPRGCHPHIGTTVGKDALKKLDLKKLQLFLQGSVSPSVNAGLLAYAETFTSPVQKLRYGKEGICRLIAALRTLIGELNEALAVNEAAMGGERIEYQQMLRRSFDGMLERLPTFFDGEKFLLDPSQDGRTAAIGVANSQLMSGVLGRLSHIGGTAAEMHIFDSISGLNA
uniref:DOCKER domain-containing protein n=1 Tax=Globodera pallida TaxID=36090 RepID=A0A183BXD3_GLOPA